MLVVRGAVPAPRVLLSAPLTPQALERRSSGSLGRSAGRCSPTSMRHYVTFGEARYARTSACERGRARRGAERIANGLQRARIWPPGRSACWPCARRSAELRSGMGTLSDRARRVVADLRGVARARLRFAALRSDDRARSRARAAARRRGSRLAAAQRASAARGARGPAGAAAVDATAPAGPACVMRRCCCSSLGVPFFAVALADPYTAFTHTKLPIPAAASP